MADTLRIVVLEGDETGQELLEQALRVLEPDVVGLELELEPSTSRSRTAGRPTTPSSTEAAQAMRDAGFGIKAATITPEGTDDVGSPNRILREEVDGKVIIRTGRRIPGVTPIAGVHHPISVVRMAVDDAYGAKQWREGEEGAGDEIAYRTEKISRGTCRAVAEYAFRRPRRWAARSTAARSGRSPPSTRACSRRSSTPPPRATRTCPTSRSSSTRPTPAWSAGSIDEPLVIPALNRDGDCLCDLVMPMFGSIAGAESVLLAFDDDFATQVAMAEAPHGTAPALQGKDIANPMAMLLACGAVLHYAGEKRARRRRARLARDLRVGARGDRRGHPDARPRRPRGARPSSPTRSPTRVRNKIDVWSSLGLARVGPRDPPGRPVVQDRLQIPASVRAAS